VRPHYDQLFRPLDPSVDLMTIPLPVALSRVEVELERMCQELDWVVADLVPEEWEDYYPSSYPEDPTCGNLVHVQEVLTRQIGRLERMARAMKWYAAAIDAAEGGGSPAGGAGQMAAVPFPTP
jgi:hypothetical protein